MPMEINQIIIFLIIVIASLIILKLFLNSFKLILRFVIILILVIGAIYGLNQTGLVKFEPNKILGAAVSRIEKISEKIIKKEIIDKIKGT